MSDLIWPLLLFAANAEESSGIFAGNLQVKIRLGASARHRLTTSADLDKDFCLSYKDHQRTCIPYTCMAKESAEWRYTQVRGGAKNEGNNNTERPGLFSTSPYTYELFDSLTIPLCYSCSDV
jgi:hypothetical protein